MSLREFIKAEEGEISLQPYGIFCGPRKRANALPALTTTTCKEAVMADNIPTTSVWRSIPGFPGYEVSSAGEVKSLSRDVYRDGTPVRLSEKMLTATIRRSRNGRPVCALVTLRKGGRTYTVRVHRLVLSAFVGPAPEGAEGCHNDGNPTNNQLHNLRWDTREANRDDMRLHGTMTMPPRHVGHRHPRAKMTEAVARKIQDVTEWPHGTVTRLAKELGITPAMVRHVRSGATWRHARNAS